MTKYEISDNEKTVGIVNVNDSINIDFDNSFIKSYIGNYEILKDNNLQEYLVQFIVNDIDELYDIVSKYIIDSSLIFKEIEKIKEYNNLKYIKENTNIVIKVLENDLKYLNLSISNVDLISLFKSKLYFVGKVLEIKELINKDIFEGIINEYNNFINSSEYEFLTDEEKQNKINSFINRLEELINIIEKNSTYRYKKDFINPIKIIR
ncbi:MAG: hypothetical protein IJD92_02590 [Bacilli bacterium]|nr:hypothetical protein [Bacilli bacterium]